MFGLSRYLGPSLPQGMMRIASEPVVGTNVTLFVKDLAVLVSKTVMFVISIVEERVISILLPSKYGCSEILGYSP